MKKPLMIPFDKDGLMEYVGHWVKPEDVEWRENYTFIATLYYDERSIGNSPRFYFHETMQLRKKLSMSISEFDRVIKNCGIQNRLVTAEWTFKKHGSTYSCVLTEKYCEL